MLQWCIIIFMSYAYVLPQQIYKTGCVSNKLSKETCRSKSTAFLNTGDRRSTGSEKLYSEKGDIKTWLLVIA